MRGIKSKKAEQLGINPSTASGRLVKDILFKLAVDAGHNCYRCGEVLTRDTFSIEHKEPWLDSEDPKALYFDQDNIAFSHLSCNIEASRSTKKYHSEEERKRVKSEQNRKYNASNYTKEKRAEKYKRCGN